MPELLLGYLESLPGRELCVEAWIGDKDVKSKSRLEHLHNVVPSSRLKYDCAHKSKFPSN